MFSDSDLLLRGQKRNLVKEEPTAEDDAALGYSVSNKKSRLEDIDISDHISLMSLLDDVPVDQCQKSEKKCVLQEQLMGITEYIGKYERTSGVVNERSNDFHVHEISHSGNIVRLTNFDLPKLPKEDPLLDLLEKETCEKLDGLASDANAGNSVSFECAEMTKKKRKEVIQKIYEKYSKVKSELVVNNDVKKIIVTRATVPSSKVNSLPNKKGKYTEFVLRKENLNTYEAINYLAWKLGIKKSAFTFSEFKDRKARSCQLIRVKGVEPRKLLQLNKQMKRIQLGNFSYTQHCLKPGELTGNHFKIVVRNLESDENIVSSMKSLAENGFINYFHLSQFGTPPVSYSEIGKALLLGNWKEAMELMTTPQKGDNSLAAKIRLFWSLANRYDGPQCVNERLLMGMTRCLADDYVVALNCIPIRVRQKYVQNYQYYLWNLIVSRRIQKFGLAVLDGDLFNDKSEVKDGFAQEAFHSQQATPKIFHESDATEDTGLSIEDVVMPLPGCDVIYPDNELSALYRDILEAEGFDIDSFRRDVKMVNFFGDYRKIVVKPKNLSWGLSTIYDANEEEMTIDTDVTSRMSTPERALTLEFSIPLKSHAGMVLREVVKLSASTTP